MNMNQLFLFFIFFCNQFFLYPSMFFSNEPRLWQRIPLFVVKERVYTFMNENLLTNCFEYQETHNQLLLKCWAENRLKNVKIEIEDTKPNKRRFYSQVITI